MTHIKFRNLVLSNILIFSLLIALPIWTRAAEMSGKSFGSFQQQKRKKRKKVKKTSTSQLIRGRRGGCYYMNRNGKKTYVSRNLCR